MLQLLKDLQKLSVITVHNWLSLDSSQYLDTTSFVAPVSDHSAFLQKPFSDHGKWKLGQLYCL